QVGALTQERTHQVGTQSTGTTGDKDDLSVDGKGGVDGRHRIPFCLVAKVSQAEDSHLSTGIGHPYASSTWIRFDGCHLSPKHCVFGAPRVTGAQVSPSVRSSTPPGGVGKEPRTSNTRPEGSRPPGSASTRFFGPRRRSWQGVCPRFGYAVADRGRVLNALSRCGGQHVVRTHHPRW